MMCPSIGNRFVPHKLLDIFIVILFASSRTNINTNCCICSSKALSFSRHYTVIDIDFAEV